MENEVLSPGELLLIVVRETDENVAELPRLALVGGLEGGLVAAAPDVMPNEDASAALSNFTCEPANVVAEPSWVPWLVINIQ
jgi:hypothetical protein